MARISAGILCYRRRGRVLEVLLVHPGGPLWAKKDAGAWTIPKGEVGPGEAPEDAARREFVEETGVPLPVDALLVPLAPIRPWLAAMERAGYQPFRPPVFSQWRRQWSIWRAAKSLERIGR